jgi:hypothetical protein
LMGSTSVVARTSWCSWLWAFQGSLRRSALIDYRGLSKEPPAARLYSAVYLPIMTLEQLKQRFEGKTVVRVERAPLGESIAKFVMSDGKAFVLHATDLGCWCTDTPATPDGPYTTLDTLLEHYREIVARDVVLTDDPPSAVVALLEDDRMVVRSPDGTQAFHMSRGDLSEYERKVVESEAGRKLLGESA